MTTLEAAAPTRRADHWNPRDDRKIYLLWLAIFLASNVVGFGLDFPGYLSQIPAPPLIVHVHAAVFVGWLFILSAQVLLIERGDVALHRKLGVASLWFVALMVVMAAAAELTDEARHLDAPHATPQFMAMVIPNILGLAGFTAAGYFLRRRPASHKRMMMLAMASISTAGFARLYGHLFTLHPTSWAYFFEFNYGPLLLISLMAGWDLWKRGALDRAFAIGSALLISCELAGTALYLSPAWKPVAIAITQAWGYRG